MTQYRILLLLFLLLPTLAFSQHPTQDDDEIQDETVVEKTGGQFPAESQGDDSAEIEADRDDFGDFQKIPTPSYSDDLRIASQTQREIRKNYFILEGYVDISYKGFRLQSDHAEFNTDTQDLIATGNVVLDQTDSRIICDRLELNLDTKKGVAYNAYGYVPPQVFFWGSKLEKLGEQEYKLHEGVFTECSQILPHWQLATNSAKMTINEYIHFNKFLLKAKKVPIFYSPYMIWPIKRERATGFLFPGFGPNSEKGFYIGNSFFWAMTRSMDSTYWLDHYQNRGWGGGAEYRFSTGKKSGGSAKYYFTNDRKFGPEWSLDASIDQDLPLDFEVKGIVDVFSSFEYIQDYEDNLSRAALRTQRAQGFLTRNWSYYSLNVLGDWSDTQFSRSREVKLYHAPETQFQVRSQKIGPTPFFWTLESSVNNMGRSDTLGKRDVNFLFQRYDAFPTISWPITTLSWLTFTPTFGYRITHYTKQQEELDERNELPSVIDAALTRDYMDITMDLRGPNFGKIFDTPDWSYSKKWKHAIEPQVTFRYIQDIEERLKILRIDEIDTIDGLKVVEFSITNLVYAKRPVKDEEEYEPDEYQYYNPKPLEEPIESAWEFLSWKVSQRYFLDSDSFDLVKFPELQRLSPITSQLRINPAQNYNIDFRVDYDVNFKQMTQIQLGSALQDADKWYTNVAYTYSNPVDVRGLPRQRKASNQIRTNAGVGIFKNRLVFNGEMDYDITNKKLFRSSIGFLYNDDCFSVGMDYRHFDFGDEFFSRRNENQITFSISLPNIGELVKYRNAQPPRRF